METPLQPPLPSSPRRAWCAPLAAGAAALPWLLGLLMLAAGIVPRLYAYAVPALGLLAAGAALAAGRRADIPRAAGGWLCALTALAMLSALWAPDAGAAARDALRLALVLLPGLLLIAPAAGGGEPAARLAVFGWLAAAALLAADLWGGMPLYGLTHGIAMGDPHLVADLLNKPVAAVTLLGAPVFAMSVFSMGPARRRGVLAAAVAVLLALILLKTASQSSRLALLVALVFAFAFPYRLKAAWIALAALLAGGVLGAPWLAAWMHQALPPLLPHIPLVGEPTAYAPQRLAIWNHVSQHIFAQPLYGHGIDATRSFTDFHSDLPSQRTNRILHPHNAALQLWMEFGVIGALLGAGFLLQLLRTIYRQPRAAQRVALPALMGCMSMGMMSYGLWQGWWLGLLVLTAAVTTLAARFSAEAASSAPSPS